MIYYFFHLPFFYMHKKFYFNNCHYNLYLFKCTKNQYHFLYIIKFTVVVWKKTVFYGYLKMTTLTMFSQIQAALRGRVHTLSHKHNTHVYCYRYIYVIYVLYIQKCKLDNKTNVHFSLNHILYIQPQFCKRDQIRSTLSNGTLIVLHGTYTLLILYI